jgi:hypothetical protein
MAQSIERQFGAILQQEIAANDVLQAPGKGRLALLGSGSEPYQQVTVVGCGAAGEVSRQ